MNPILLDFPDQMETPRLLIRAPRGGDGAILNRAVRDSAAELSPWMPWARREQSPEESEANIRQACADWVARRDLRLLIFDKSGEMVGSSGLHRIDWEVPKFEIGYWGRTGFGGRGLMTEAVRAIADFAFETLGAQRVEILCDANNLKSAALAKRAGFTHEATLKNYARRADELLDMMVFARLRADATALKIGPDNLDNRALSPLETPSP